MSSNQDPIHETRAGTQAPPAAPAARTADLPAVGAVLAGRYRLDSVLGRGGMGVVYRAHDRTLDRDVALKLLADPGVGTAGRARLLREARAAARLNHPHIVSIHDAGETDGTPFIVLELVEGRSLRELTGGAPLPLEVTRRIGLQLCDALAHAHAQGIVHRDLKPENVLVIEEHGEISTKLADLGVARLGPGSHLTADGVIVGTPLYLAPEQALGDPVDGRADLYALGALLYELASGRPPFTGDDPLVIVTQHIHTPAPPLRRLQPELPPAFAATVMRLLAKRPGDRFPSAEDVGRALAAPESTAPGAIEAEAEAEPTSTTVLLDQLARGRLVGRAREVQALREHWRRALRGQSQLVLLSGEPGIGKTRLASETMVGAQLSGALVMRGGCYELEATTPYLPFVEMLRAWVQGRGRDELAADLGPLAPELARLAPEIEGKLGPLPANPALSPNEERLRLFDHVARFFRDRAGDGGVLVFLDDLHWADQGTLSLLHYLVRHLRADRALFLGAYREMELDRSHPLATALVEWNRERLAHRIALGRLSAAETGLLLATLFGQERVSDEFATAMHRETEGNPFFIEEVVKSLIEQGQIYREHGDWQRRDVGELALPQSVKEAIGRRLSHLDDRCVEVLHAASALGKIFAFPELAAALAPARNEDEVLDALDEAAAVQLVRPERGENFIFTHDKIREVLYEELNPVRRRRLHQRIGDGLETLHARDTEAHVQDLAHHFQLAGDLAKALLYSRRAARKAEQLFAHEEAIQYYEQAHECADAMGSPAGQVEALEGMAAVHLRRGTAHVAGQTLERALELATDPGRRAMLKARIGEAYVTSGEVQARDFLEEALRELDPAQTMEIAVATAMMGRYHHYRMEHGKAVELLTKAQRIAEPIDDADTLLSIYAYLAGAYQHMGRIAESMRWARRCIELGERKQAPLAIALGHEFMAEDTAILGRWRAALAHTAENRRIGLQLGARDRVVWADFAASFAHHLGGELDRSREFARSTILAAEEVGDRRVASLLHVHLVLNHAERGEFASARAEAGTALAIGVETGQLWMQSEAHRALAVVHMQEEDWAAAEAAFARESAIFAGTDNGLGKFLSWWAVAETKLGLGKLEEAKTVVAEALAIVTEAESDFYIGVTRRVEGKIAMAEERWEDAARSLDLAVACTEKMEARLELARALMERSRLRFLVGDRDTALADRERAMSLFEQAGARLGLERARALGE